MATIIDLEGSGALERVDPQLEEGELEHRFLYVTAYCSKRITEDLPGFVSEWKVEEDPSQPLDALLETFCSGGTLAFLDDFKPLTHHGNGIWELKTADLRIFGWFAQVNVFIATNIFLAGKVKEHDLYHGLSKEAERACGLLDLDEPKYLKGEQPSDVVTGFSYSK